MKIPTNLDLKPPPLRRILAQNPPFKEFLDPALMYVYGSLRIKIVYHRQFYRVLWHRAYTRSMVSISCTCPSWGRTTCYCRYVPEVLNLLTRFRSRWTRPSWTRPSWTRPGWTRPIWTRPISIWCINVLILFVMYRFCHMYGHYVLYWPIAENLIHFE